MLRYNRIYYRNTQLDTVGKLFESEKIVNISVSDFLDVKSPLDGKKNRDSLFATYTDQQKKDLVLNSSNDITSQTKIYPPCTLYVPIDSVTINIIKSTSLFVKNEDYDAFLGEKIKSIIKSENYAKSNVSKMYPKASVWAWSKSLEGDLINKTNVNGQIINITDFVEDLKITVADTGGSFSISMTTVPMSPKGYYDNGKIIDSSWEFDNSRSTNYINSNGVQRVYRENIHEPEVTVSGSTSTKWKTHDQEAEYSMLRRNSIGVVAFNVNDLVFIKLNNEINYDLYLDNSVLHGEMFDMIGLIDSVTVDTDTTDTSVNISGRDCMKLILDDGSFFFPKSYSDPDAQKGVFINQHDSGDSTSTLNALLKDGKNSAARFIATGLIMPLFNATARNIEFVLNTLIKTLSNIQICPDALFDSYGDDRTRFRDEKKIKK